MSEENVVLGGRYRLGRILGTGGMAEVFLAEDTRLHRTVAVKVLRSDLARDANFQERFRREAHSAASLNHPAIVAVYDTGEEQQRTVTGTEVTIPYIVMEYVHGTTLRDVIDPEHPMDAHHAGEIMAALLSALEYSHRAGIVHRDIKPGNIMITEAGAVKVMDFGIARAIADATSAMTATQAVMGTAQYLSPEQARGQLVDARSDIYSAACVMYEMLTGRPPFTGDTPVSIAYQHVREEPHPPSAYNPAISPAMDAVILTGLTKDREQRYPSAVAFSRDIAAVVSGRSPALVAGAAAVGEDPEATTLLGAVDAPTEALSPLGAAGAGAAGLGAAGLGTAGMHAQNWTGTSATTPTTGPLALRPAEELAEEDEESRKPWWLILLVVVAVLALVGTALAIFRPWEDPAPETVAVPSVVGDTEAEARAALTDVDLKPEFVKEESQDVPEGTVISTDPPEGTQVTVGDTVEVVVSSGPADTTVPDITGKSREDAEKMLEDAGLVPKYQSSEDVKQLEHDVVSRSDPSAESPAKKGDEVKFWVATGDYTVPDVTSTDIDAATKTLKDIGFTVDTTERADGEAKEGTVLAQTPPPGGTEKIGATITLTVAVPVGPVKVPNVEGRELADAEQVLTGEGFGINHEEEASDTVEEGRVIRTSPGANEEVDKGSTITIIVSTGPKPKPSPTPTPTSTPTPTEEPTTTPTEEPSDSPTEETTDPGAGNGNGKGNGKGKGGNG